MRDVFENDQVEKKSLVLHGDVPPQPHIRQRAQDFFISLSGCRQLMCTL